MATTKTQTAKSSTTKTTTTKKPKTPKPETSTESVSELVIEVPKAKNAPVAQPKKEVIKTYEPSQIITVRNGYQGKLVYRSRKTNELFVWENFGGEQEMEYSELKSARSSSKKYFINNWFMFDDADVVHSLGLSQYYKFAIGIEEFDTFFEKSSSEIKDTIGKLSDGQKRSVAYRARQLISEGAIDSNKTITTLEESLGVELIDR